MKRLVLVIGLLVCLGTAVSAQQQASEDNWTLPWWVQPSANSGLYGGFNLPSGVTSLRLATVTWKQLNPSEGVYDWSAMNSLLAGQPFILRLYSTDVIHCPAWLKTKYPGLKAQRFRWPNRPYPDTLGNTSVGDFYPPWNASYENEFHKFLMAFRAKNFASNAKFVGWYVPGGWEWNEWSLKWVPEMAQEGITPSAFLDWFNRLMTDYVLATNGHAGKLIYTGTAGEEWVEYTGDSTSYNAWVNAINPNPGRNAMASMAYSLGAGARDGAGEWFNYDSNAPDWGTTLTGGYMVTKDSHPFIASGRFFGTENECFGTCGMPAGTANYYHAKMATLKALQLRMNWVFLGNWNLAPSVFNYMLKTLGKTVHDSPDAWVALREAHDTERGSPGPVVKNWERWLTQRDVSPRGITVPTAAITSPAPQIGKSYEARRTNRATTSDWIHFNVNDQFIYGGSTDVDIYVTYLDNNHAKWSLSYDAYGTAIYKKAGSVQNIADGKWKTVKFAVTDAGFSNRQAGATDFQLYNGGVQDLTVRFVRVVKVNP